MQCLVICVHCIVLSVIFSVSFAQYLVISIVISDKPSDKPSDKHGVPFNELLAEKNESGLKKRPSFCEPRQICNRFFCAEI